MMEPPTREPRATRDKTKLLHRKLAASCKTGTFATCG